MHRTVDRALPVVLAALGLLHPESPATWYAALAVAFVALAGGVLGGAALVTAYSERQADRIHGPRKKPAPMRAEAMETARAMFVAATLAAWPITQWWLGHPTGMVRDLAAVGLSPWAVIAQTLLGVVIIDAWLYWKHRLLHTPALHRFHAGHHAFPDPTAFAGFAGFAVAPVEALLTFWPIVILCIPQATHWLPLYVLLVGGFIGLNFYLHCGIEIRALEAVLPKLGLNSSAFHNKHHSHFRVNYGEASFVWDILCKPRLSDERQRRAAAA